MATSTRALIFTLALTAAMAGTAEGQSNFSYPGVYIQEVSVTAAGGGTARGSATLLTPQGEMGRPGTAVVLEVEPGPLQQALARSHRLGLALEGNLRGRGARDRALEWKLEKLIVTSHAPGRDGAVRFVLEPAPPQPAPGQKQGKVEYSWKIEEGVKVSGPRPDLARISQRTREQWVDFWTGLPAARAAALERDLRAAGTRAERGQSSQTDLEFVLRAHPDLARMATALQRELGLAPSRDDPAEWRPIVVPVCTITKDGPRCDLVVVPCAC